MSEVSPIVNNQLPGRELINAVEKIDTVSAEFYLSI
jgi:hypothetical protein